MSSKDKSGPQEPAANAGGDEAFISFAFVIVTVVMLVLYSTTAIRTCKVFGLALFKLTPWADRTEKRKRAIDEDEEDTIATVLLDAKNYFLFLPSLMLTFINHPGFATHGLRILMQEKTILTNIALPKLLRNVFRARLIVVVLWVVLFSMALYSNLSFDAYKVLDLSPDATEKEVKKRYRQLTKMHHPDHNRDNATSLAIYTQVRKAYKALVNKEEFEKEAQKEDLSIGVALPSWLTNRENDFLIKILVLATLVGLPYWLFKKFSTPDGDKISILCKKIVTSEIGLISLYKNFGIPDEKKFINRIKQVELLTAAWSANNVVVPDTLNLEYLPPVEQFLMRYADSMEKHLAFFAGMGLQDVNTIVGVCEFLKKGMEQIAADAKQSEGTASNSPVTAANATTGSAITPIGDDEFEAAFYVFRLAVAECEKSIDELNVIVNNSIKPLFVLKNFHKKIAEVLIWSQQKKVASRDIDTLVEAPRFGKETALSILPTIHQTMQKYQKEQQKEYTKQMHK